MLGALGLEPDEEAVYRALLGRPSATAAVLADVLRRCRSPRSTGRWPASSTCGLVDPTRRRCVHRRAAGDRARRADHRAAGRAAHGRAGAGDLRRGTPGGDGRAQHQRADRGGHRRRRHPAPLPPGAAGGPRPGAQLHHRAVRRRAARREHRPSPRPSSAACASGRYSTGRCWPSPASSTRPSSRCATAWSCGWPTRCR